MSDVTDSPGQNTGQTSTHSPEGGSHDPSTSIDGNSDESGGIIKSSKDKVTARKRGALMFGHNFKWMLSFM